MSDFDSGDLLAELFGVAPVPAAVPEVSNGARAVEVPEVAGGPEVDLWTADTIDGPEPCPTCGSLEKWWDVLGRQRCSVCEAATLARGLRILRPVKSAPGRAPRGDAGTHPDMRHPGSQRPPATQPAAFPVV